MARILDLLLMVGAHWLSRRGHGLTWSPGASLLTCYVVIFFSVVSELLGTYGPGLRLGGDEDRSGILRVLVAWCLSSAAVLASSHFVSGVRLELDRIVTPTWFLSLLVLLPMVRALGVAGRWVIGRTRGAERIAIYGSTRLGHDVYHQLMRARRGRVLFSGLYDDRGPERRHSLPAGVDALSGTLEDLLKSARASQLDTVYVCLPLSAWSRSSLIVNAFADTTVDVRIATDLNLRTRWRSLGPVQVLSVYDSSGVNGFAKRLEDIVISSAVLLFMAPWMALIALMIKAESPGPILFRQKRYGLNGREIGVLKFRTMSVAEDGPTIRQATKNDRRVTRLGAFLRRNSIDELPQFLNVLMGDMSIVGPRPHAIAHDQMYRTLIAGYMLRHKVKPGITGWAQVNGWRGETAATDMMERRVEHDLEYIRNWSLIWDLKILLLTALGLKSPAGSG